jgi:GNAT superfamily N-acetyltransferase
MIQIRSFTLSDIPFGLQLSGSAGWNQTDRDWTRMLELQPDGAFAAEWNQLAAGTVSVCLYGDVAWIAMMLVESRLRRRGIGRALMIHALDYAAASGARTVQLDATPLGQPLYESLGFRAEYALTRHCGRPTRGNELGVSRDPQERSIEEIMALDRRQTGLERGKLLRALAVENPEEVYVSFREGGCGYLLVRPGRMSTHVGPCVAEPSVGEELLERAFDRHAGESVYIDIPNEHRSSGSCAVSHGLKSQRQFLRMTLGPSISEQRDAIWASAGPEWG